MEKQELERLIGLKLQEKVAHSKTIIREALRRYSERNLFIAWTGGKDSTSMLWLFRETFGELGAPMPRAMFIDEGSVFDEIHELIEQVREEWDVDVAFVKNTDVSDKARNPGDMIRVEDLNERNRHEVLRLGFKEESFPFEPESFIGNHLMKTVAMNLFLEENRAQALSTAIRWDEQEARIKEEYFSSRTQPDHIRVHPILHFREKDIWNLIFTENIPHCSLYAQGYRSLGAKGSTVKNSDIPAWEQDLENTTERAGRGQDKEKIMEQLRDLGYM